MRINGKLECENKMQNGAINRHIEKKSPEEKVTLNQVAHQASPRTL